jgi:hypothetical protein
MNAVHDDPWSKILIAGLGWPASPRASFDPLPNRQNPAVPEALFAPVTQEPEAERCPELSVDEWSIGVWSTQRRVN